MRRLGFSLISALFVLFSGCSDNFVGTGLPPGSGNGQIRLSVPNHPPEVTALRAALNRPYTDTLRTTIPLPAPSQAVVAVMANVPAGPWHLGLEGISETGTVLYSGGGDVRVTADSTVTAAIFFNQLTGTIEMGTGGGPGPGPGGCVPPAPGIVSWWPGENSTQDAIDGNDGMTGWPGVSYAAGRVGTAFRFDGVSGQIRVPDNPNLRITGSLTIEAWILAEGYPEGRASGQILFRGDDRIGIDPYYLTMLPDGRLRFHVGSLSGAIDLETSGPVPIGTWHHVAAVLNSGTDQMSIYLDGQIKAATLTPLRPFRDLDPMYAPGLGIGNTQGDTLYHVQPFHGMIDELSVYNTPLGPEQMRAIFDAGAEGKCGPNPPPPTDSLIAPTFAGGFQRPAGLVFSVSGQLLVANFWDPGIISSVTPDGIAGTFAPGPGRAVAAVARDSAGYVYGTYQDQTVKKIPPGGGTPTTFISGIINPAGIAVHPDGNIYVVDANTSRVNIYSPGGLPVATLSGNLNGPVGIAIDTAGVVYVADRPGNRIMKLDSSGSFVPFVEGVPAPHDMAFDSRGRLFVTGGVSPAGHNVFIITPEGVTSELPYWFNYPVGITFDASGNLYVSNYGGTTVSKVVVPP